MVKEKKYWAFIDKTGKKVIETRYEDVDPFKDGLAEVRREVSSFSFGGLLINAIGVAAGVPVYGPDGNLISDKIKRGYIDKTGAEVISTKNDYTSPFHDGAAIVKVKGKWGAVDQKGAYIVEPKYNGIHFFSDGLAAVKEGAKWGYVGKDGRLVIPPTYDEAGEFTEGIAVVRQSGKAFFIDKEGHVPFLVPKNITDLGMFISGLAPAKIGDKWGFIDTKGNVVITPAYDEVRTHQYSEGFCRDESVTASEMWLRQSQRNSAPRVPRAAGPRSARDCHASSSRSSQRSAPCPAQGVRRASRSGR